MLGGERQNMKRNLFLYRAFQHLVKEKVTGISLVSSVNCQEVSEFYSDTVKWVYVLRNNWADEGKLDGVGPVDNRPSTDKLHHFEI